MSDNVFTSASIQRIEGEPTIDMITRLVQEQQIKSCSIIVHGEDEVFIVDDDGNVSVKHWDEIRREAMRKRRGPMMIAADIDAGRLHFPLPPPPIVPATPYKNYREECADIAKISELLIRVDTVKPVESKKREKKQKPPKFKPVQQKFQRPQFRNTNMRGKR